MGESVTLKAADGHDLDAYLMRPKGEAIAGLVVVQEAFGVNQHIRSVADGYARDGFLAIAPALFDRVERGLDLGYEGPDRDKGLAVARQLNPADAMKDVAAAMDYARRQTGRKCGVIGYCLGGTMAWLSATRLNPDAAVGYYAGRIGQYANEAPQCPVMLHFGKLDKHIPKDEVGKVQSAHPEVEIFWYEADHGFNCDLRSAYNPEAAKLARERSLALLREHLLQ